MADQTNPPTRGRLPEAATVAPVIPTAGAAVRLRPIGLTRNRLDGGLWADRRRTNHQVTIPRAAGRLEAAGNLTNFRLATGAEGMYRGENDDGGYTAPFLDSDVYKWLEAVAWDQVQFPDRALLAAAEPMIALIGRAQRTDGYVDTFYQAKEPGKEFTNFEWGHELYVAGHLVQAAIAWQRGLGDDRLLKIARHFVARIEAEIGPGKKERICGHPELEMALVELYRCTGEARYLDFARALIDRRGRGLLGRCRYGARYWQDHEPVLTAGEPTGHAVRQLYLDCGVVDVAVESGDRELLGSAIRRWDSMISSKTFVTGGLGAHHQDEAFGEAFELPTDRAYSETCAAIASVMLSWRLLLATGEARYADLIERTIFNAVLPGLAFDGEHFFYANPLMRRSSAHEMSRGNATTHRAPWLDIACCPPNLMRLLAEFPDMVATADGTGVQLHQYVTGSVEAPISTGVVSFRTETAYPWQGAVKIAIDRSPAEPWTLSVRVPEWCDHATARVAGTDETFASGPGTIEITRRWRAGDELALDLPMPPRATAPDPRIDAVRGAVALERGPLVYAIEDIDLGPGESVESVEIAETAHLDTSTASEPELGEITWLTFDGLVRDDRRLPGWPYLTAPEASAAMDAATSAPSRPRRLRALPYFAWANRSGLGMRVWIPMRRRGPKP